MRKDVIVIGGGAAGLFCAIHAGRRGRSTLVLERSEKVGRKIAISGGGRCNFTNLHTSPAHFICGNRHFHKSALARCTPEDFLAQVERHGIRWHEKKLGQLFCDGSAQEIIRMLLKECNDARVEIRLNSRVHAVEKTNLFRIATDQGDLECESLVVATGGLSLPKLGATDFGYGLARQFGLGVLPTKPGLVPLTFAAHDRAIFGALSGIALDARVSHCDQEFRERILITHHGLSGPAILQISSYWNPDNTIAIDLMPDGEAEEWLARNHGSPKSLKSLLRQFWPQRFAEVWAEVHASPKPLQEFSRKELRAVAERLRCWRITPGGTEGYGKAEVTAGGVDTCELSSQTMAALRVAGLYFIGEVVDVTGQLGGFNLQWAWASGFAAGQAV